MQFVLKHKNVFLVAIPLSLMIILFVLDSVSDTKTATQTGKNTTPTPIRADTSPAPTSAYKPPVSYNKNAVEQLVDKFENEQPLLPEDQTIRQQLVNSVRKANVVHSTDAYVVTYVKSADVFMVEIRTINVGKAKKEATTWFTDKGLSDIAVCNLPIVFYLNHAVANQLRPLHMTFNPLPEGC